VDALGGSPLFHDRLTHRLEEPDRYLEGQGYLPVTDVINGVMQPVNPGYAIYPASFGPNPIMHDFYATQPSTPPYAGSHAFASTGVVTDTANNTAAQVAAGNPMHPRYSPLLWSIAFLVIGLVGLRLVHWG
jgi:hypothetical protein